VSRRTDLERQEDAVHRRIERSKQIRRDMDEVVKDYAGGEQISHTARRLNMSRHRVRWLQRVLGLMDGKTKAGWLTTRAGPQSVGMEA
jgi:hypothetical protein